MSNSLIMPHFDLLLQAIRVDDRDLAVSRSESIISENEIDWEYLYSSADLHSVRPQLGKLTSKITQGLIPAGFTEKLNEERLHILFRQLSYADNFLKVHKILEDAGIEMIPFKGFCLAHDAYGNLADRESMDVDVFVSLTDLEKIQVIMKENGYQEEDIFREFTLEEIKSRFQEYNFDRMAGDKSRFHIEFHWGICPPGYGMDIRLEDLRSQIITGKFQGREMRVFTPEAHLLLVLLHHGGKDRFLQLKQILDIALIVKKHEDLDWTWVINETKRFDAEQLIYVGVKLAGMLTGVSVPEVIRAQTLSKKTGSLAKDRILSMMRPYNNCNNLGFNYNNWLFRMRTRKGLDTRFKITAATGRELLMKKLSAFPKMN